MSAAEPSAEQLAGPELDWAKTTGNRGGPPAYSGTSHSGVSLSNFSSEGTRKEETDEVPGKNALVPQKNLADAQRAWRYLHH